MGWRLCASSLKPWYFNILSDIFVLCQEVTEVKRVVVLNAPWTVTDFSSSPRTFTMHISSAERSLIELMNAACWSDVTAGFSHDGFSSLLLFMPVNWLCRLHGNLSKEPVVPVQRHFYPISKSDCECVVINCPSLFCMLTQPNTANFLVSRNSLSH